MKQVFSLCDNYFCQQRFVTTIVKENNLSYSTYSFGPNSCVLTKPSKLFGTPYMLISHAWYGLLAIWPPNYSKIRMDNAEVIQVVLSSTRFPPQVLLWAEHSYALYCKYYCSSIIVSTSCALYEAIISPCKAGSSSKFSPTLGKEHFFSAKLCVVNQPQSGKLRFY